MKTLILKSPASHIGHSWLQLVHLLLTLTVLTLAGALISGVHAQDADPASRVARISYLKGRVFMQPAEADAWTEARVNRPLTNGDQLWTESHSRSELQIGAATLQIDANTQLRLLELSDAVIQVEVTQGLVNVRVRSLEADDIVELDTPNAAINALQPGTYRVEVSPSNDSTIIQIRAGSAEVAGERQTFSLREGEQLNLQGSDRLSAAYDDVPRMDEFDRWASARNQRAEQATSARYVANDVIGYEDLDEYGDWRWYANYGYVWRPTRVVSGWTPYRYGHWTWVSPWGWTWVDDSPWGFAPFHYGRWATINNRWCWVPGPRTVRAVYAPALVAWMGTPGLSIGVNIGTHPVGWIPLGPREVYRPNYRVSERYLVNINISNSLLNNTEFERSYRRQPHDMDYGNRRAMSVVTGHSLSGAQPVNNHLLNGESSRLRAIETAPMPRPDTTSMLGGERRAAPPQLIAPDVVTRRHPTRASTNAGNSNDVGIQASPRTSGRDLVIPERNNIRVITTTPRRGESISGESGQATDDTRTSNRPSVATPSRNQRSTVNKPYIRPNIPSATRNEPSNEGARRAPIESRGPEPVTPESGETQRGTAKPEPRTARPDTSGTERGSRNNTWVRDEAPLRRGSAPSVQTPSSPATVTTPRNELQPTRPRFNSQSPTNSGASRNNQLREKGTRVDTR
ncbi:MAG: DUF6600 domain-containing protein [Steroidobacteraceae bacterium]